MIIFPAIDLKGGQCVRLKLGDMDQATVFNDDPGAQAKAFQDQGFEWLHVVDLDGAFAGGVECDRDFIAAVVDQLQKADLGWILERNRRSRTRASETG